MIRVEDHHWSENGMDVMITISSERDARIRIEAIVRPELLPTMITEMTTQIREGQQTLTYSFPLSEFQPNTVIDFVAREMIDDAVNGEVPESRFEMRSN